MTDLDLPAGVAEQLRWEECPKYLAQGIGPCDCKNGRVLVLPQFVVAQKELTMCSVCNETGRVKMTTELRHAVDSVPCPCRFGRETPRVPFSEGTVRLTTTREIDHWCKACGAALGPGCPPTETLTLTESVWVNQYDRDRLLRWNAFDSEWLKDGGHSLWFYDFTTDDDGKVHQTGKIWLAADIFDALPPCPKVLLIDKPREG